MIGSENYYVPLTSPTVNQHSMIVFLTSTSGLKTPGFYYWESLLNDWIRIIDGIGDKWFDWETLLSPTAGNANAIAIGTTARTNGKLNVYSNKSYGIYNALSSNFGFATYANYNAVANSGNGEIYGNYNLITSTGSGNQTGYYKAMVGNKFG